MALEHNVKANAVLGFKVGTQAAVDAILSAGSGAVHGSFYLTKDTHRLYVGNEDTSLSPVNEGVITVATIGNLPTVTSGNGAAYAGRFYYVTQGNILCVYNGSDWVQINTNTNTTNETFANVGVDITDGVQITSTLTDSEGEALSAYFHVTGDNGVVVTRGTTNITVGTETVTVPTINVSADYSITTSTNSTSGVDVNLVSEDNSNNSHITVTAAANAKGHNTVTVAKTAGGFSIAAKDTTVTDVDVNSLATGFEVVVTDLEGEEIKGSFAPKITYGTGANATTVDFVNGTATLNVYTKGEVDDTLKVLNAMVYRGTIGTGGSGATAVNGTAGNFQVVNGSTNVDSRIGDTYLVTTPVMVGGTTVNTGSLLIARSTTGAEQADGTIAKANLAFDIVAATQDTDTTYTFEENSTQNGIVLRNSQGNDVGELKFAGDTWIDVSQTMSSGVDSVTISHKNVTRTDPAAQTQTGAKADTTNSYTGQTQFTAVTGVTSDAKGHITAVQTKQITVYDTNASITGNSYTSSNYTKSNKNVGVMQHDITMTAGDGGTATSTSYNAISSQGLTITADDTNTLTSTSSSTVKGINIEMLWGSF